MSAVDATFILGVDLDGVCADHSARFRDLVAERLDVDPASLPLDRSWDFHEWGFGPGDFEDHHRWAVMERRMFRDLPVIAGAPETLWRLSDAGAWIRIITHRLCVNWGHAIAVADTVEWLDTNAIPYRDLCFLGAKPQVEADLYIDDGPHNIEDLQAAGNEVIIFDAPYNRHLEGRRARTWAEAEEMIEEVMARHRAVQRQLPGIDPGVDRLERRRTG